MPTTHYGLTSKQLAILDHLYRFRFATSKQLSQALNTTQATINKRLKLMMELGYIGRKYEPEYRLLRKHAAYYLAPEGIKELKGTNEKYAKTVLKNLSNDVRASERFVNHWLGIFNVYLALREQCGSQLRFFTKSQLVGFDHYPQPLPDAYVRLEDEDNERLFFLDVLHESQPFFIATRKVMQYVAYATDNYYEWEQATDMPLPSVLLICDSASLKKRLQKKMKRAAGSIENSDMNFFIGTLADISTWHDLVDADEELTLSELQ